MPQEVVTKETGELIDDVDDKVRRNLVVFSGVVIALSFLGVPMEGVAQKLIGTKGSIPVGRLVAVAFGVLAYLLARYRFLKQTEELMAEVQLEKTRTAQRLIVWVANIRAWVWTRGGPDIKLFDPVLRAAVPHDVGKFPTTAPATLKFELMVDAAHDDRHAHVRPAMSWASGQSFAGGGGVVFEVNNRSRHLYRACAWAKAIMYSKPGVTYAVPLVLAGSALVFLWATVLEHCVWPDNPPASQEVAEAGSQDGTAEAAVRVRRPAP